MLLFSAPFDRRFQFLSMISIQRGNAEQLTIWCWTMRSICIVHVVECLSFGIVCFVYFAEYMITGVASSEPQASVLLTL